MHLDPLQYPIGRLVPGTRAGTPQRRAECVRILAAFPGQLRTALAGLSDAQVDTPYRPGGWTVRQVTHHLADSHMNAPDPVQTRPLFGRDQDTSLPSGCLVRTSRCAFAGFGIVVHYGWGAPALVRPVAWHVRSRVRDELLPSG
ncbi:MAG: maleylpyruvate isomerase N-terminal domain-containing protein [Flavobacteriales bacterium]|nr:maleylpyruvate isomerase N-terminal domain-containing protein [Flavobacteriales bacterium]